MQSHQAHGLPGGLSCRRMPTRRAMLVRRRFMLQALAVWASFLGFAVINGLFRQTVLEPHIGTEPAHFLSTTTLAGFVFFVTLLFVGLRSEVPAQTELLAIGMLWAVLTALLELGMGLARGVAAAELFRDYDISRGRLFGLLILAELLSPPVAGWLRRLGR
jgi:hypothetical protein